MDIKYILLILSWLLLLAGIVLIVLSYTIELPVYYGGALLGVGAIISLIAVILRQKDLKRRAEEEKRKARQENKH